MVEVSFSDRFKEEVVKGGYEQDLDKLKADLTAHLTGIEDDEMPVSYLGRTTLYNEPIRASDQNLGKVHVWDTTTAWFTKQKQKNWKRAGYHGSRTSDTYFVYAQHLEDEYKYKFLGVLSPGHEKSRHGGNGYAYLEPLIKEAKLFQDEE